MRSGTMGGCARAWAPLVLYLVAVAGEPSTQELLATVAAQSAQVATLSAAVTTLTDQVGSLTARISVLERAAQSKGPGDSPSAPSSTGTPRRRLSSGSARSKWHGSLWNKFDAPDSAGCDLHAELDHSTVGPLGMRRLKDGNVSIGYASDTKFTLAAPLELQVSSGCASATLVANHALDAAGGLSINGGTVQPGPFLTYTSKVDSGSISSDGLRGSTATFNSFGQNAVPSTETGLSYSLDLDEARTVLINYQVAFVAMKGDNSIGVYRLLHTDLFINTDSAGDVRIPEAKAISGTQAGYENEGTSYGTNVGIGVRTLPAGNHVITVKYRVPGEVRVQADNTASDEQDMSLVVTVL